MGVTLSDTKLISRYWSTWRTSVRIASVTLRISAVSGGVSTSRLSAGTIIVTRELEGTAGWETMRPETARARITWGWPAKPSKPALPGVTSNRLAAGGPEIPEAGVPLRA